MSARRTALLAIGWTSLGLGILGAFLPVLPTTCFVLLAAWCFARASPRLHRWLRNHPLVGSMVVAWETDRSVPLRGKVLAVGTTAATCSVSALMVEHTVLHVILAVVVLGVGALMWRLPTREPQSTAAPPTCVDGAAGV